MHCMLIQCGRSRLNKFTRFYSRLIASVFQYFRYWIKLNPCHMVCLPRNETGNHGNMDNNYEYNDRTNGNKERNNGNNTINSKSNAVNNENNMCWISSHKFIIWHLLPSTWYCWPTLGHEWAPTKTHICSAWYVQQLKRLCSTNTRAVP